MTSPGTIGRRPLPSRLAPTPWFSLLATVFVWGANVVAARAAVGNVSPFALVTIRWLVVCFLLAMFTRHRLLDALRQLRPHWRYVAPMGAFGFTISNVLFFAGANYTSGLSIAIVIAVIPVLVIVGASIAYRTRIGARRMTGVALTILGILLVATQGDLGALGGLRFNIGDLIELVGGIAYAGFTVALRSKPPLPAFVFFIGIALSAFAISIPGLAVEVVFHAVIWPNQVGWLAIIYVAVFTSLIGQGLWIRAVEIIGPSRAGVFQNLVPIIGATLSVLVLGETFHWYHGVSLAFVLCGIWISERTRA